MFNFDGTEAVPLNVPIQLRDGSFVLVVERPSADERIVDDAYYYEMAKSKGLDHAAAYRNRFHRRLDRIIGWTGIEDSAGKPVEFSKARLETLLNKCPAALDQLVGALGTVYQADEQAMGKLEAPAGDSPPAVTSTASPSSTGTATGSA